ncbi:MAG: hypothetical protein LBF63_05465 [Treponema sp.]|jgi:hypothetical protein|nr:hypothetical protein [Treponema sp.]
MNWGPTRFFPVFFFLAVLNVPAFAADLYILVVETGGGADEVSGERQDAEFESSFLWETCLLDVFFEAGHVASNSPALRLGGFDGVKTETPSDGVSIESPSAEFPREFEAELAEARSGRADYVVLALLSYSAIADRKAKPERVILRVYRLEPYRFVYEGTAALAGRNAGTGTETETGQAKRLIRGLIPHIKD